MAEDTDKAKRREIQSFIENFEKRHKVNVPRTSGARPKAKTQGHRLWGAGDYAISHLDKDIQEDFITNMASSGFRVIDERHIPSKKNPKGKGIVHVDLGVKERSKTAFDEPGTIRKERLKKQNKNNYPIQKVIKQQYFNPEREDKLLGNTENINQVRQQSEEQGKRDQIMNLFRQRNRN